MQVFSLNLYRQDVYCYTHEIILQFFAIISDYCPIKKFMYSILMHHSSTLEILIFLLRVAYHTHVSQKNSKIAYQFKNPILFLHSCSEF